MRLARLLVLWMVCFSEIHVRASDSKCSVEHAPCTFVARQAGNELIYRDLKITLSIGTLVELKREGAWRLVEGSAYVVGERASVESPFGRYECAKNCKALVDRSESEVSVKALSGAWSVLRLGDGQMYSLSPGHSISLGAVRDNGKARMSFPDSLPWGTVISQWAKLYRGELAEFKVEVSRFREVWREATEVAAALDEDYAKRAIASHEAAIARRQALRRAQEAENAKFRQIFRQKNYLDQF